MCSRIILSILIMGAAAPLAWADGNSYCQQLQQVGLKDKYVTVTPADGGERNFTHGYVVSVRGGTLTLDLGGYRSYINCDEIHSVTVKEKKAEGKVAP